jgi:hypothetical protein
MKPLGLLLVGVVVGWAASGVDWTRDAEAQQMGNEESNAGGLIDFSPNNLIEDDHPRVKRFQISSYGEAPKAGCFIVDTMTGRLWHAVPGGGVHEVRKGK